MLNLKNTITINVDWTNLKSIELAELQKSELENSDYILINTFGGVDQSALLYAKNE